MTDAATGWNDERVAQLSRLWSEGLSASQIAAVLGGGVTRNAVIGKVHRLGLAGRVKSGQPAAARPAKPRLVAPSQAASADDPAGGAPVALPSRVESGRAQLAEIPLPETQRVSILELRDSMCRWPLGDPTSADFGFCGARSSTGLPYCAYHCRIAYQPAAERKRIRSF